MKRSLILSLAVAVTAFTLSVPVRADVGVGQGGGTPATALNFSLVGHNPLFGRGMNAALAIYDHYVYVGNRSDASRNHPHPGILIVDVADPSHPTVVGEIGPPDAGQVGVTTRELRVWPQKKLLVVLTFDCSSSQHACKETSFLGQFDFYDLSDPLHPKRIQSQVTKSRSGDEFHAHEFFLWIDPKNPERALLWESIPNDSLDAGSPTFVIEEISAVPSGGPVRLVAQGNWSRLFPKANRPQTYDYDLYLHSMTPSFDGTRTYLAHLRGGFGILDTSKIAHGEVPANSVESLDDDLLTPVPFPAWGAGSHCAGGTAAGCMESHSAVPFPGRPYVLTTDEVYGTYASTAWGWPWGWARLWNVADPKQPQLLGEYKLLQNTMAYTPTAAENQRTSYTSHNPTLLGNLALVTWYSGGLQAIDVSNPAMPVQSGWFSPEPLATVATEDPALTAGPNKVEMWSYPIVKEGLIYVLDVRNGFYLLRYTGPLASEVTGIGFLEGNSNLGAAARLDQSAGR